MTRKRGRTGEVKKVEEIKIDPACKYLIIARGLSKEQLGMLRIQLGDFFRSGDKPFFILGVGPEHEIEVKRIKDRGG